MRLVVDLTLPMESRLLSQTRRVFRGYLEEIGVDHEDVSDVVLAMAEACTNVVRHAALDRSDCYHLSAEVSDDEVVVIVEDEGVGMAPGSVRRAVADGATSGRGLQLIRELMTSVDVETEPDRRGTCVRMRKSLKLHVAGLSGAG
jgi:serine/threonine-protein kinase RsbW